MPETPSQKKFYLTTPIYYVNARPHIGHAYTTIVADVLARRHRLLGEDTFFLTGTDEHGQKIERSAFAAGVPPQQFADGVAASFRALWDRMGITYDDFIRTTEGRHKVGVQRLFQLLQERGAIYKGTYTGQYCVSDEAYVEGPPGIHCPDCGRLTETVSEENYYFRLSEYQGKLLDLIESDTLRITPESRRNEVLSFVRGGLKDLSISRTSFHWGIPVPGDEKHVIYVWLDALANYMTAVGYGSEERADQEMFARYWPADLHLVGKEIIRFHCVYWPAFLLAAGLPLPRAVTAHGWLLFEESKMSKSRGNIVRTETILDGFGKHVYKKQFPDATKHEQDLFGSDVLRYFLLREVPFGQDGSFSFDAMITRYNADLANGYGNLVSRTLNLVTQNFDKLPANLLPEAEEVKAGDDLEHKASYWCGIISRGFSSELSGQLFPLEDSWDSLAFNEVAALLQSQVMRVDAFLTTTKPWALAKQEGDQPRRSLAAILYTAAEAIRIITALLYPMLPFATARVWEQLGLGSIEEAAARGDLNDLQWGSLKPGTKLGALSPIFPRADKGLAQTMADMESPSSAQSSTQTETTTPENFPGMPKDLTGTPKDLMGVTADNDARTSERTEFAEAPFLGAGQEGGPEGGPGVRVGPVPSKLSNETTTATPAPPLDPTHPAAGPRTSALPEVNPIAQVAGSAAITTERPPAPSHTEAQPSGPFATAASAQPITTAPGPVPPLEAGAPTISIDDFAKVEMRVAKVVVAERIPKADKLLRLEVDLGNEKRQILSGIAEWYAPEDLLGRRIVVITNLAPRKMRGLESHGMLLAASGPDGGRPALATFADSDDLPLGSRLK